MKIAMVHTSLWGRGGAERQILKLAIELERLGNTVELFVPSVNEQACYSELLKQVTINVLPRSQFIPFRQSNGLPMLSTGKIGAITRNGNRLRKIMVKEFCTIGLPSMISLGKMIPDGFDVINNHNAPTEWAAFVAKKRLHAPIVWLCNEPPSWFYSAPGRGIRKKLYWPLYELWDKTSVKYIDDIMVLSYAAANLVKNTYNRSSKVVRTGLDIEKFCNVSGASLRKKYGLEDGFVLLQVANFSSFKRQSDSVKALGYLSKKYGNVKLILDGSGPQEELKRLIEKLGLESKVLFSHAACDTELVQLYAACDAFVFPAPITWGLAVVEAMAASKPVIVTKGCGAAEIIEDNVTGLLFEHAMPQEIAKKVEFLINNPNIRDDIGKNAAEYVKENLSWAKFAKNIENIFQQSISRM